MKKYYGVMVCGLLFCQLFINIIYAGSKEEMTAEKSLFETKCSLCHEMERPLSKRKDKDGWTETVKRMQSKKAGHISDAEAENIIAYLVYNRGEGSGTINKVKDPANMTELEKKHVPVIQLGMENKETKKITVTVKIGVVEHPMAQEHYIEYIELFIDGKSAGKAGLKPGDKPEAKFEVEVPAGARITAREDCNIHGLWEGELK